MRILKIEALSLCKVCPKFLQPGYCDFGLIEGSNSEEITPPGCMRDILPKVVINEPNKYTQEDQKVDFPFTNLSATYEGLSATYENKTNKTKNSSKNSILRPPHSSMYSIYGRKPLNEGDLKILELIGLMYPEREIARILDRPRTTIQYRLKKLENKGFIKSPREINIRSYPKFYDLTTKGTNVLIHNQLSANYELPLKYDWHATCFKAEILGGARPKGHKSYRPKNWKVPGEIFNGDGYKIRLTPKYAIIDIHHQKLKADSESNLLIKYASLAQHLLNSFSKQYNIQLGQVELNREPHKSIPNSKDFADYIMNQGGEIYCKELGIQIDHSHEMGEVEFVGKNGAKTARSFAYVLNQMPAIVAATRADAAETRADVAEMKTIVNQKVSVLEKELHCVKIELQAGIQKSERLPLQNRGKGNTFSEDMAYV